MGPGVGKNTSYRGVEQGLARWAHNPKVGGSNPSPAIFYACGGIAQSVEQRNHNPCVVGSIPAATTSSLFYLGNFQVTIFACCL